MTVATVYGSLTTDQASVKPDGNPVCASLHYPHFLAGQTEASELIDLPKVTQLVGLEARINTQMCLVPEPSWGHQALKLGAKGRRVGGGGRGGRGGRGGLQGCWHCHLRPLWSALPLPSGSYSLQFAHEEAEARTSAMTVQGFPALEWLL